MNSAPDGRGGGLDPAPPDSGLFAPGSGALGGASGGTSNNGGNRFFQMLVGSGSSSQDRYRATANAATTSSPSRNSSFDLNDFPSLGDQTHHQIGGFSSGVNVGGGGSTSATDFAAALSRAATGTSSTSATATTSPPTTTTTASGMSLGASSTSNPNMNGWSAMSSNGGNTGGGGLGSSLGLGVGVSHAQNFSMASEDFPALPGAPPGSTNNGGLRPDNSSSVIGSTGSSSGAGGSLLPSAVGTSSSLSSSGFSNNLLAAAAGLPSSGASSSRQQQFQMQHQQRNAGNGLHSAMNNSSNAGYHSSSYGSSNNGSNHRQQQHSSAPSSPQMQPQSTSPTARGSTATTNVLSSEYGMLGLRGVLRGASTDVADRNALTQGTDLTLLGMNMNSADPLYRTFAGPFADVSSVKALVASGNGRIEPMYQIPSCYYIQTPALKTGHLARFQLETLFYIFYALPQDVQQAFAAQELYARDWRYHGELKVWFKLLDEDCASVGSSTSNHHQQQQPNQLVYFDTSTWEKRLYNGNASSGASSKNSSKSMNGTATAPIHPSIIANGFLTEQEVRVRVTAGGSTGAPQSS